jgi:hypothetical protein
VITEEEYEGMVERPNTSNDRLRTLQRWDAGESADAEREDL